MLALGLVESPAKKPPACMSGRFLVVGPSIVTGDAKHDVEPVSLADGRLAIADACAPTKVRLKRTKRGTAVRSAWKSCTGFKGRVRLGGTIMPDCSTLTGTLVARKSKVKRAFTAIVTRCGDGLVDAGAGEGCEPPGSLTCTPECQAVSAPAPAITIDSPANFALTNAGAVDVTGTVSASVVGVACNGRAATRTNAAFSANVPLTEGHNTIVCVASAADSRTATASVSVSRDATGPRVGITSPKPGATLTATPVTAAGFVNDLVAGDLTTAEPTVVCNGVAATVANRTFVATGIALAAGPRTITCTATDPTGNASTANVNVTLAPPSGPSIHAVSGDAQTGPIGAALPALLVVMLDDGAGQPVAGKTVIFRVIENDGTLAGGSGTPRAIMVTSGVDGHAAATFTLGTRAGAGNQQVRATAVGFAGEVVFTASATVGGPARIIVDSGTLQTGLVGQPLPRPFVATVIDAGNNRLAGVQVTFTVVAGGGSLADSVVATDLDGRAHTFLTLGPTPDEDGQVVSATFAGNPGAPVRFVASARQGGDPAATRITGVVLDGSNLPVPNALVGIGDTSISTMTDAEGQFTITPAPVGRVDLWIIGSTTTRAGVWPSLPYELVTVPGEDNTIGMPIRLPELDVAHGVQVDETHGGTVAPPDLPGFTLTIAPGSATFPDGTHHGLVTVTAVHPDKIPMVPQFGQQPRVIVTIQPAGTRFDPPAPLTIPNADGLPPGQKTEMFSFDHDLRSFVTIGTGTVSEDGSVIRSDPGVGVVKAGWHCGGNPAGTGTCQHECDDGESCTDDKLVGGQCQHTPKSNGTICDPAPDTLECGGGGIRVLCVTGVPMCQSGVCTAPKPGGGPNKRDVYKALSAMCQSICLPGGGCSGSAGAAMKQAMQGQRLQVVCKPTSGCQTADDCACAPKNSPGSVFVGQSAGDPSTCGDLAGTLRHELQHKLLNKQHDTSNGPINCATDPIYGCDAACGHLNCCTSPTVDCAGFVNKADRNTCAP
jgi:hypothetical protein